MRRDTQEECIEKFIQAHGNLYDYSLVKYEGSTVKVKIICKKENHGIFEQSPFKHKKGQGCPICAGHNKTIEHLISDFRQVHGDKYIYDKVIAGPAKVKVEIGCKIHGIFKQTPNSHLNGNGCPTCGDPTSNTEEFIKKALAIHGHRYDYSKVEYNGSHKKVKIYCILHEVFEQEPSNHLNGQGCPTCSYEEKASNTEEFIEKARKIHSNKYDYKYVDYNRNNIKVKIVCSHHGIFEQTPLHHLSGQGCPLCGASNISDLEIEWLDYLRVPQEYRQKRLKHNGKEYIVDGYDPTTNTIYEFYGSYWHGDPARFPNPEEMNTRVKKPFWKLLKETLVRKHELQKLGYNLVIIWESQWEKIKKEAKQSKKNNDQSNKNPQ